MKITPHDKRVVLVLREGAKTIAALPRTLYTCTRCGYTWLAKKLPVRCAKTTCRSPYWGKARQRGSSKRNLP